MSDDVDVSIPEDLREHLTPLEAIHPYADNAKTHPEDQIDDLVGRIRKDGWDVPIVTDEDGEIVKGHGRRLAAQRLGMSEVPVVRNSYSTEADKRAARLADNRVAESEWDDDLVELELQALDDLEYDVGTIGFDEEELDEYLEDEEEPPEPEEVDVDEHSRKEPSDADEELESTPVVIYAASDSEVDHIGEWATLQGYEWRVDD